jgi:hypothetical protein
VQPGYGDGSPYDPGPPPPGPPAQAGYGGPLPDYLQPGFTPRGSGAEPASKNKLWWIVGALVLVLIVAALVVVLAA